MSQAPCWALGCRGHSDGGDGQCLAAPSFPASGDGNGGQADNTHPHTQTAHFQDVVSGCEGNKSNDEIVKVMLFSPQKQVGHGGLSERRT